jgi:hypothetical protein
MASPHNSWAVPHWNRLSLTSPGLRGILDRYIELLSRDALVSTLRLGVTYVLPSDIA